MKITAKLLNIPPYISTAWTNITSLYVRKEERKEVLVITMQDATQVEIPNLSQGEIDAIFEAHAKFSESESHTSNLLEGALNFGIPFKLDSSTIDSFNPAIQHNSQQSDLPPIPVDILKKVGSIIQALGVSEIPLIEKAHSDCNCVYCQLARSFHKETEEEEISSADLQFRDWEISQKEKHLYHVVNPLDKNEYYDVFLGEPLGCTCGHKNCEHIRAVLNEPFNS
jgi:hypothetical protein